MNLANCRRFVAALMYVGVVALVIVNGQSTTGDDFENAGIEALSAELRSEQAKSADAIKSLQRQLAESQEKITKLESKGYAAGPQNNAGGSGSNFLCLPDDPQWKTYNNGHQTWTGSIYGVEYELFNSGDDRYNNIFSETNSGGSPLLDNPAPCAVCYVADRSTILMVPARTQCPDGWTTEYQGYLVSEAHAARHRSSYICWDEAPEVAIGTRRQNQAVIYPVAARCGSLPCQLYPDGKELTCIVCSK